MSFPNPFSEYVQIPFSLNEPCYVRFIIYDSTGKEVTSILDQNLGSGNYTAKWNAHSVSKGMYMIIAEIDQMKRYSITIHKI